MGMPSMPPIHLSDDELTAVMNACRPLQPRDRDQFLKDIAAELAAVDSRRDRRRKNSGPPRTPARGILCDQHRRIVAYRVPN
jgi:hypothetical protein